MIDMSVMTRQGFSESVCYKEKGHTGKTQLAFYTGKVKGNIIALHFIGKWHKM